MDWFLYWFYWTSVLALKRLTRTSYFREWSRSLELNWSRSDLSDMFQFVVFMMSLSRYGRQSLYSSGPLLWDQLLSRYRKATLLLFSSVKKLYQNTFFPQTRLTGLRLF